MDEDDYLSTYHVARYKGYLTALEDVLEALDRKKTIKDWLKKRMAKIEKILGNDRHSKFDYTLNLHEGIFC